MDKLTWILLALAAGSALPLQGGVNSKLGKALANPSYAALVSFSVGALALMAYVLVTRQSPSWEGVKQASWFYWTGGILSAAYVTTVILTFPKLGSGLTFASIVAGQMIISLILDHFHVLVAHPQPINLGRVLGAGLIVGGVILLQRFQNDSTPRQSTNM
ncbi:DMT family transporter [Bremerella alba]|uniref:DMT family transporter n=1 Tax=Bremerella alba TaxID=980252 RepID=A0A7V8VAD3_9BACT|nr:DMT family transporter [Bremerella alba]MBA2117865.1 hypothetical protein [Bremerella alba]